MKEGSPKSNTESNPGTMADIKSKSIASPKLVSKFSPINTLVNRNNLTVNTGSLSTLKKYG